MVGSADKKQKRDYSKIGYYGKPITSLSREELLTALAELADMYNRLKQKNEKYEKVLSKSKS